MDRRTVSLALFVACVLLLGSSIALGATVDCTIAPGTQTWTGIGLLDPNSNCLDKGAPPDGDDHVICPDGTTLVLGDDVTYTGDGSSLELQSGCKFEVDIPTLKKVVTLHFMDGQDGVKGTYDSVALWEEAGAEIETQSAYLTYGLETPLWQTSVEIDNNTIWTVPGISTCDLGAANAAAGTIGGTTNDCATGTESYGLSIIYSDGENNPEDGNDGDTFLEESIGELTAKMFACFLSGMDRGQCYSAGAIDSTASQYAISLRVLQLIQPDEAAIDYVAFTKAKRKQALISATNAAQAGDKCIEYDDTVSDDVIAAKGDYVNFCAYVYDPSGQNGWPKPLPITRTLDDIDCDGAAGDDSLWFPEGIPFDLAGDSQIVISPTCFGEGDRFVMMAMPIFEVEDGNGEWTLGDGKMLFEGTNNNIRGLVIDSAGTVKCLGCSWRSDPLLVFNSGADNGWALDFEDPTSVYLGDTLIVGGPQTDDGNGVRFDGPTGGFTDVNSLAIRYCGGTAIQGVTNSYMGRGVFDGVKIERAGKAVMEGNETIVLVNINSWSDPVFIDLMLGDPTGSTNDYVYQSLTTASVINGGALRGQVNGGLIQGSANDQAQLLNFLASQVDSSLVSGKTWLGDFTRFGEFRDVYLDIPINTGIAGLNAAAFPIIVSDSVFENVTVTSNFLIYGLGLAGEPGITTSGNTFYNVNSTHANCTNGTGCAMIHFGLTSSPATVPTMEGNLIAWDKPTSWTKAVEIVKLSGDGVTNFGGNSIVGMRNENDNVALFGFDLASDVASVIVQRPGFSRSCVGPMIASGSGSTVTEVDDHASYNGALPLLGRNGELTEDHLGLAPPSTFLREECGRSNQSTKAGIRPGHSRLYEYMGVKDPHKRILDRSEGRVH